MTLHALTIHELQEMLAKGQVSAVEATRDVLDRIEKVEGKVNAYISLDKEHALQQAEARLQTAQAGLAVANAQLLQAQSGITTASGQVSIATAQLELAQSGPLPPQEHASLTHSSPLSQVTAPHCSPVTTKPRPGSRDPRSSA